MQSKLVCTSLGIPKTATVGQIGNTEVNQNLNNKWSKLSSNTKLSKAIAKGKDIANNKHIHFSFFSYHVLPKATRDHFFESYYPLASIGVCRILIDKMLKLLVLSIKIRIFVSSYQPKQQVTKTHHKVRLMTWPPIEDGFPPWRDVDQWD